MGYSRTRLVGRALDLIRMHNNARPFKNIFILEHYSRPRSIFELRAKLKSSQSNSSPADPPTTKSPEKVNTKTVVLGFADDKPIQILLDNSTTGKPNKEKRTVNIGDKPFIVTATSVSSSVSSSVGGFSRRSDVRTKMKRKDEFNDNNNQRRNIFNRFFRNRHERRYLTS